MCVHAGENALPCITASGINMHALSLIVQNTRACIPLPRRASDIATRSLAMHQYIQQPLCSSAHGSPNNPQGPGPLPASISFSPPMHEYFGRGGLASSRDACMRKAPSQLNLVRPAMSLVPADQSIVAANDGDITLSKVSWPLSSRSHAGLQSLAERMPEGPSSGDANAQNIGAAVSAAARRPDDVRAAKSSLTHAAAAVIAVQAAPSMMPPRPPSTLPAMRMFTFLRFTRDLVDPGSQGHWLRFMSDMCSREHCEFAHGVSHGMPGLSSRS